MLLYGKAHLEISAVVDQLKKAIAEGEAVMAEQRDRLEHFIVTEAALLGITDPASIPAAPPSSPPPSMVGATNEAATTGLNYGGDPAQSATGGLAQTEAQTAANDTRQAEQGASA